MNIFTDYSAFFAAPYLAEILDAKLYVIDVNFNNFFGNNNVIQGIHCGENTKNINNDDLIIIGYEALKKIKSRIEKGDFKKVCYIISDTKSCINYLDWNSFIEKYKIDLYVMPDIKPYCKIQYKPIYQYIRINKELVSTKPERLLISHSPRSKGKLKTKGTEAVIENIKLLKKSFDFDFLLITGKNMDDCIREKSRSHIFIDQLVFKNPEVKKHNYWGSIEYTGALGKSGIEGMLLNCCVITGAEKPVTEPYFDTPPIIWSDYDKFYEDLKELIINSEKRNQIIHQQNQWLKGYYSKEFFKSYFNRE